MFQTPFGTLHIVTLPMGWTNSVPILHDDVTYILQPEVPHITIPYIDDTPVKGPKSEYRTIGGSYETIPENPAIRRFVWEHFENLNRVVECMKYCGRTFLGPKLFLCIPEIIVLGHRCNIEGHMADPHIAVGFFLSQCDPDNPRKHYYSCFRSITLNERESCFSQAKLELYGLYRALGALQFYLIGVQNLIIEVDA
jgi:hypothetical protein